MVLKRALWLYYHYGGAKAKEDCVKQAVSEYGEPSMPEGVASMFDITQEDYTRSYIRSLTEEMDKEILKGGYDG